MTRPLRQRGATLIEGLVALLVLSMSLLAALKLQAWLRLNADLARERGEAVLAARQDLERLRVVDSAQAFDGIATQRTEQRTPTTTMRLDRSVVSEEGTKTAQTTVRWQHRGAGDQSLQLVSTVARLSPVYSAALDLPPQDKTLGARRHLPAGARSFPDGAALFRPSRDSAVTWVIDAATGLITAQCQIALPARSTPPTPSDLTRCEPLLAKLVHGHVRFSMSSRPDLWQANDMPLPMSVQMRETRCETERITAGAERSLAYACAAPANAQAEPRFVPQGWAFGPEPAAYKSCRYPFAPGGVRNYLVIHGNLPCPTAQTPHNGDLVATVQHQP